MIAIQEFSLLAWVILGLLAGLSIFAVSIVVVKLGQFSRMGVGSRRVARNVDTVLADWHRGDMARAQAQMDGAHALRLQVLDQMLFAPDAAGGAGGVDQAMGHARDGIAAMNQYMRGLEAVVQAAPMLGLLGTVVGMIEAFGRLATTSGAADPAQLAGGIWTALVTTALGLAVAIVFYLLSLWLEGRIAGEAHALEQMIGTAAQIQRSRGAAVPGMAANMVPAPPPVAASASPFGAPAPSPAAFAPLPERGSLAQPLPGGPQVQRTHPGPLAPHPAYAASPYLSDPAAGSDPAPEGFRTKT